MPTFEQLLASIDGLGVTRWSGTAFRHTAPNRNPLEGFGARQFGGRWNPPGSFSTIYLASPFEACIAEFLRMAEGQGRGAASFLPRDIYTISIKDLEVLDLTPAGRLDQVGLTIEDIQSVDWAPCQSVGAAAYFVERQGLLAPSATGIGLVIAVFETRVRAGQLTVETREPMRDRL